jgi:hypothetical protein
MLLTCLHYLPLPGEIDMYFRKNNLNTRGKFDKEHIFIRYDDFYIGSLVICVSFNKVFLNFILFPHILVFLAYLAI